MAFQLLPPTPFVVSAGRFCTLIRMEPAQLSSAEGFPGPSLQRTDQNDFLRPPDGADAHCGTQDAGMASLIADPAAQRLRDQNPSFRAIPSHYYVLHLSPLSLPPPFAFDRGHWSPQVHRFQPVKPPLREVATATPEFFCISNFIRRDRPFRVCRFLL
jgi:hypothetical protein